MSLRDLEQAAEQLLQLGVLPESYSEGAKLAWARMQNDYGPEEGRRIFVQKAVEWGVGTNMRELVDSTYAHGTTLPSRRQAIIDVRLNRDRPVPPTVRIKKLR